MPASKNLLIIEDDPDLRMTLEYFLGRIGYQVLTAKTAEEGLQIVFAKHPRAVLCDISLPGMDGYDACERIKGDPATEHTAVIFISAKSAREVMDEGAKACADYFIPKPVDPNDVGADLYTLFEKDFDLTQEEVRTLRVTKRVPQLSESMRAGYGPQDPHTVRIMAPAHTHDSPRYEKKGQAPPSQPSAEFEDDFEAAPPRSSPSAPPPPRSEPKTPSSMELRQVHDLLLALRDSLKDTGQRLDAILQYIDVIDSE